MLNKVKGLPIAGLLALALEVQGCARSAPQEAPQAAPAPAAATAPAPSTLAQPATSPPAADGDCLAIGDLPAREACFATSKNYADCNDEYKCVPYRKMHYAEADLKRLEERAFELADKVYSGRDMWDKNYYKDLKASFTEANAAWRSYRDAHCTAQQFYAGTSRPEMGNLAEVCRLELTTARIEQMKEFVKGLEPQ